MQPLSPQCIVSDSAQPASGTITGFTRRARRKQTSLPAGFIAKPPPTVVVEQQQRKKSFQLAGVFESPVMQRRRNTMIQGELENLVKIVENSPINEEPN
jgi:hypothetical protein